MTPTGSLFYVCDQCGWAAQRTNAPDECPHCGYTSLSAFPGENKALAAAELNRGFDQAIDEVDRGGMRDEREAAEGPKSGV